MATIHIKKIKDYQPTYKDKRNLIWIRWDIKSLRNFKLNMLSVEGKWFFLTLICLETENKRPVNYDPEYLSWHSGIDKSHIPSIVSQLDKIGLVKLKGVTKCDEMSPTYRHTDIHTYNTNKQTDNKEEAKASSQEYFPLTDKEKGEIALLAEKLRQLNFNLYVYTARVKKYLGYFPPPQAIIKIANQAVKTKPKNIWGYFTKALNSELPRAFARLREEEGEEYKLKGGLPTHIKNLMEGFGEI